MQSSFSPAYMMTQPLKLTEHVLPPFFLSSHGVCVCVCIAHRFRLSAVVSCSCSGFEHSHTHTGTSLHPLGLGLGHFMGRSRPLIFGRENVNLGWLAISCYQFPIFPWPGIEFPQCFCIILPIKLRLEKKEEELHSI